MRFPRSLPLAIAALLALLSPASAEEDGPARALALAKKIRSACPVPHKNGAFTFEGDLQIAGEKAGTVRYAAEPTDHDGKPAWLATEDEVREFGGSRSRYGATLTLAQDLSLIEGEIDYRAGDVFHKVKVKRAGDGFEVEHKVSRSDAEPQETKGNAAAPAGATYGRAALLLFLRALPRSPAAAYALPWVDPLAAGLPKDDHTPDEAADAMAVLEPRGDERFGEGATAQDSFAVAFHRGQRAYDLHLSRKDRSLIGIFGRVPPYHVVPTGTAGAKTETDDDKPAKTWKAAFLKFGHGYHMANRTWIEAAFHWPTMYEYECNVAKSWSAGRPIEEFKTAWIDEFISRSLHRPRADADQLLAGTLATGKVVEETEDSVVFAAAAEFGGGVQRTYHLKKVDGVWYLVRIEF